MGSTLRINREGLVEGVGLEVSAWRWEMNFFQYLRIEIRRKSKNRGLKAGENLACVIVRSLHESLPCHGQRAYVAYEAMNHGVQGHPWWISHEWSVLTKHDPWKRGMANYPKYALITTPQIGIGRIGHDLMTEQLVRCGLRWCQTGKKSAWNAGKLSSISGSGRSWKEWLPT